MDDHTSRLKTVLLAGGFVVLLLGLGGLGWYSYQIGAELTSTTAETRSQRETIAEYELALQEASSTIAALRDAYAVLELEYEAERTKNEDFEDQISDIGRTVGVLDKLARTDEELLRKYSRVSFLNENYIPESLTEIPDEFKYDESREHELLTPVLPFFTEMLEDAREDGVELYVVSAYRSFEYQADLKGRYLVTYGTGANAFSADQGFSEHQLGTAVDFTTTGLGGGLLGFGETPAFTWLQDNAHRYGFILSYPPDNQFYVFEPWHWRFVGVDLARDLHRADAHFYDWEQRKIDEYLISIFD